MPAVPSSQSQVKVVRPPGPRSRPIIGLFPEFRKDPPGLLWKLAREYGDLVYFKLGPQHMYLVNRPEWIQDILVTGAHRFRKSRILQRAKMLLGEGLLTSEGADHLRQRRLVQPAFHRQRLAGYAEAMVECAQRTSARWQEGATIDVATEMTRLTLAIVGRALFSAEVEDAADDVGQAMSNILGMFDLMLVPYSQYLQHLPLSSTRRYERAKAVLDSTIYRIIRARRAEGIDRGDLLSMLLLAQDEQGDGGAMTDQQVRDESLTLFLAGHETTANALTWAWYLLAKHPEAEARLQAELQDVLCDRSPSVEDLPQLRYTEMVFSEALRLYPPAWAIGRLCTEAHPLGGYTIPEGSVCLLSPFAVQRDDRWFDDPLAFRPERWAENRESRPKFAFFPFGGGARVCIGERFAWMEGILVLATLARQWRVEIEGETTYRAVITLRPRDAVRGALRRTLRP